MKLRVLAISVAATLPFATACSPSAPARTVTVQLPPQAASTAHPAPSTPEPSTTTSSAATASSPAESPSSPAASPSSQSATPQAMSCLPSEGLCFDLPDGWHFEVKTSPPDQFFAWPRDDAALKDDTGNVVLFMGDGISGIGGTCPESARKPTFTLYAKPTQLGGYKEGTGTDPYASVSETVVTNDDGTYTPYSFITIATKFARVGQSNNCALNFGNLIPGHLGDGHALIAFDQHSWGATKDYRSAQVKFGSREQAAAVFATKRSLALRAVLLSARYR